MITNDQAINIWGQISGKSYEYLSGKFKGRVVKATEWEVRRHVLFIKMSDGQMINYDQFHQIVKESQRATQEPSESGVSQREMYDSGGETPVTEEQTNSQKTSQRFNIPDLDPSGYVPKPAPKPVKEINPIHTILEKAPKIEQETIPIEIKIDIVNDDVLKLLEITFPEEAYRETISFYKDKININSIKDSIESSLAKYLVNKFSTVDESAVTEFEDGIEGVIEED